jgi:hypothetical protein
MYRSTKERGGSTVVSALHDRAARQAQGRPSARDSPTPHRLLVLGIDAADIVSRTGGLVFDTVRAGLRVEVFTEGICDELPLRILGAQPRALPDVFEFESEWPDAIFFAAELHQRHPGVRRLVGDTVRRRRVQIAVWGDGVPSGLPADLGTGIEHQLSGAAQAFKHHAMKAAGMTAPVAPTESFRSRSGVDTR